MKEKLLSIGSIITSFFAAICCIGIALFTALGLGALGLSFASVLTPYSNVFKVLTILMLALAHYLMAKNNKASKSMRIILWVSTIISVGVIMYSTFFGNENKFL